MITFIEVKQINLRLKIFYRATHDNNTYKTLKSIGISYYYNFISYYYNFQLKFEYLPLVLTF